LQQELFGIPNLVRLCLFAWMWAVERRDNAIQFESNARAAPFDAFGAERDQQ
jgi:hypothetical protein